jgi:site-specific DNA-methyltransferase (adenine-specific)
MAPRLQTSERAARGKTPTDVWWHTIVPTNSRERTGYPTQKPLGVLRRIVAASSRADDLVVDWCAGSGTTGVAAQGLGRRFILVDRSGDAVTVMRQRLGQDVPVLDLSG